MEGNFSLPALKQIFPIHSNIEIRGAVSGSSFSASAITRLAGALNITNLIDEINLPLLEQIDVGFSCASVEIVNLSLPSLIKIGNDRGNYGDISFQGCTLLESISFPSLVNASGIVIVDCPALETIDLSALVSLTNSISIYNTSAVSSIDVGALESIPNLSVVNTSLTSIDLSTLISCFGIYLTGNASLTTVTFGSLLQAEAFDLSGCALTESTVDAILVELAGLDGTGGTTLYENQTVDLSGGTSAPPSATGLAAKAVLEGRGCTVSVNS